MKINTKKYLVSLMTLFMISVALGQHGMEVDSVKGSLNDGIRINYASDDGVHIQATGDDGINIVNSGGDGISITNTVKDGIHMLNTAGNGLEIQGLQNGGVDPQDFTAYISNNGDDLTNSVLALRLNNPGALKTYITFLGNWDPMAVAFVVLGFIAPNGSGGLTFDTGGSDYAEYLEKRDKSILFQPGDIVGVTSGKISFQTNEADLILVVTDQAAIAGKAPSVPKQERSDHEIVSFMGQVRVKVIGKVHSGDWIVPSGNDDGIGIAVPTDELKFGHQIVGQAWESSAEPAVKRVNTAVGLDHSEALKHLMKLQQDQIVDQHKQIEELRQIVMELAN